MMFKDKEGNEYHTIIDLAVAIGLSVKTIKRWEKEGYFPKPRIDAVKGWRAYTKEEIERLAKLAEENDYFRPKIGRTATFVAKL